MGKAGGAVAGLNWGSIGGLAASLSPVGLFALTAGLLMKRTAGFGEDTAGAWTAPGMSTEEYNKFLNEQKAQRSRATQEEKAAFDEEMKAKYANAAQSQKLADSLYVTKDAAAELDDELAGHSLTTSLTKAAGSTVQLEKALQSFIPVITAVERAASNIPLGTQRLLAPTLTHYPATYGIKYAEDFEGIMRRQFEEKYPHGALGWHSAATGFLGEPIALGAEWNDFIDAVSKSERGVGDLGGSMNKTTVAAAKLDDELAGHTLTTSLAAASEVTSKMADAVDNYSVSASQCISQLSAGIKSISGDVEARFQELVSQYDYTQAERSRLLYELKRQEIMQEARAKYTPLGYKYHEPTGTWMSPERYEMAMGRGTYTPTTQAQPVSYQTERQPINLNVGTIITTRADIDELTREIFTSARRQGYIT
jgi:hypothetical protein